MWLYQGDIPNKAMLLLLVLLVVVLLLLLVVVVVVAVMEVGVMVVVYSPAEHRARITRYMQLYTVKIISQGVRIVCAVVLHYPTTGAATPRLQSIREG